MEQINRLNQVPRIEQRSTEWYKSRLLYITASEASAITGENSNRNADDVLFEKLGVGRPFVGNAATEWGQYYEDEAILCYSIATGRRCFQYGLLRYNQVHNDAAESEMGLGQLDFIAGSPDGVSVGSSAEDPVCLVEVKCPYRRKILQGQIPRCYYAQVQLNMLICGLTMADFIEYRPDPFEMNIVRIPLDMAWLKKNIPILRAFSETVRSYLVGNLDIQAHPKYKRCVEPRIQAGAVLRRLEIADTQ